MSPINKENGRQPAHSAVDFSKPIRPVDGSGVTGTLRFAGRVGKPPFEYLIVSDSKSSGFYVDSFGRKESGLQPGFPIQGVVENFKPYTSIEEKVTGVDPREGRTPGPPPPPAPPKVEPTYDLGEVSRRLDTLIGLVAGMATWGKNLDTRLNDYVEKLSRIQDDTFHGLSMLVDEVQQKMGGEPLETPVVKAPTPAPPAPVKEPEPAPTVILRKAVEPVRATEWLEVAVGKVFGLDGIASKIARARITAVATHGAVSKIIVNPGRPRRDTKLAVGWIEPAVILDNPCRLQAVLYGHNEQYSVDVHVAPGYKTQDVLSKLNFTSEKAQ